MVVVGSVGGSVSVVGFELAFVLYTKSVASLIFKCLCFMMFFSETYVKNQAYEIILYRTVLFLFKKGIWHEMEY